MPDLRSKTIGLALLITLEFLGIKPADSKPKNNGSTTGEFPVWHESDSGEFAKLRISAARGRRLAFPPVKVKHKPKSETKPKLVPHRRKPRPVVVSKAILLFETAKRYIGIPYVYGGDTPSEGFDCSGYTRWVYRKVGIELPRTSAEQATVGYRVYSLASARLGDLVFFHSPVSHVGIYIGHGQMIASPHSGSSVRIQPVYETPSVIRRVL